MEISIKDNIYDIRIVATTSQEVSQVLNLLERCKRPSIDLKGQKNLLGEVFQSMARSERIQAIKKIRDFFGYSMSLKEAREFYEDNYQNIPREKKVESEEKLRDSCLLGYRN